MPALSYRKCTLTELRGFIISRCHLYSDDAQKLEEVRRHGLTGCLRALDRNRKFKFFDLPPELRLRVYRYTLKSGSTLLRASRLIYNEALPVLQEENTVNVSIDDTGFHSRPDDHVAKDGVYNATVIRRHYGEISRRPFFFYVVQEICGVDIRHLTVSGPSFDTFRGVRHVRIKLGRCLWEAQRLVAALCIAMSGASQLRKLTTDNEREHHDLDQGVELVGIFWPVAFLHADVEIEAARNDAGLQTALDQARKTLRGHPYCALEPPGELIAKAGLQPGCLYWELHDFVYAMNALVTELILCSNVTTHT